ncbi:hypothetical protein C8R44DRAFT_805086 [Mycena epipterygia]|nr:hypothetical protein C8R44DRAFT_805086 [Mycena epipterygia]
MDGFQFWLAVLIFMWMRPTNRARARSEKTHRGLGGTHTYPSCRMHARRKEGRRSPSAHSIKINPLPRKYAIRTTRGRRATISQVQVVYTPSSKSKTCFDPSLDGAVPPLSQPRGSVSICTAETEVDYEV